MNDIHKAIGKLLLYPVVIFIVASMFFNTQCNFDSKRFLQAVKESIPKKEETLTPKEPEQKLKIDGKEVSRKKYLEYHKAKIGKGSMVSENLKVNQIPGTDKNQFEVR